MSTVLNDFADDDFPNGESYALFLLFVAAMRPYHWSRQPYTDHDGPQPACAECQTMAFLALRYYIEAVKNAGGDCRAAVVRLNDRPLERTSLVKSAHRRELTARGLLARPFRAAAGARYQKALRRAHDDGRLEVSVEKATELLGRVIAEAQSPTGVISPGDELPWAFIGSKTGLEGIVERVWFQIVDACDGYGPAAKQLDAHVHSRTERFARQLVVWQPGNDGDDRDPVAAGSSLLRPDADRELVEDVIDGAVRDCVAARALELAAVEHVLGTAFAAAELPVQPLELRAYGKQVMPRIKRDTARSEAESSMRAAKRTGVVVTDAMVLACLRERLAWHGADVPGDRAAWERARVWEIRRELKR